MAKTKIYSNEGQKVKELSGPIIRGKKYPKGTVVTSNPAQYQANQDSLNLYNRGKNLHEKEMQVALQKGLEVYDMIQSSSDISEEEKKNFSKPQRSHYRDYLMEDTHGYTPDAYSDEVINLMNSNPNIKPQGFFSREGYGYGAFYKKPTNMVFVEKINRMQSKGMPISTITPNKRVMPDIVYKDNNIPNAAYNKGMDIYHRTDGLGRWVAQLIMSTQPGIRGRISTPNPKGNYTKIYKYK